MSHEKGFSMTQDQALSAIAESLVKGVPLSYKFYADGHLVVIAPSGKKFVFTAEQVRAAEKALKPPTKRGTSTPRGRKKAQPTPRANDEEK